MHGLVETCSGGAAPRVIHSDCHRSVGTGGSIEAFERAKLVRRILWARARREEYLSARLFAEPAWDMLLELYVAHLLQRRMSITGLCGASRVPATTALRWIDVLQSEDLVLREKDPLDGRRIFVELTVNGSNAIKHYFDAAASRVWPNEVVTGNRSRSTVAM
jgi:DNA-binding MarR family transcriptional regulator